jgi:hypothetical protein
MNFQNVVEVATTILVALGGAGSIVVGLSSYLGKIWADRGLTKQKQEYNQLNLAFQSQLDIASRRLQVELDALGLVHKLRTQEEFTRLAELWKQMATLRNDFAAIAQMGLTVAYQDPEARRKWEAQMQQQFESHLDDAQKFLTEEALFIPKPICDKADAALVAGAHERLNHVLFAPYLVVNTVPSAPPFGDDSKVLQEYQRARTEIHKSFVAAMAELEPLMREHIAGHSAS